VVSIALIVLAYLLIFPAFVALRLREPGLKRPFRVPMVPAPPGSSRAWPLAGPCWPPSASYGPDSAPLTRTQPYRRASRRSVGNSNFSFSSRSER
jgi:hypothetical protein